MSNIPRSDPIPIGTKLKNQYHRIPTYPPPDYITYSQPINSNQYLILENKKQKTRCIYRLKIFSNIFRFTYFISSILLIFSPHIWNKDWSLNIESNNFKIGLFSIIGSTIGFNTINCCLHSFILSLLLVFIDIFKFVVCAKINYIEKYLDGKNYSDHLEKFGYILCIIFLVVDLILVVTTYKIKNLYKLKY